MTHPAPPAPPPSVVREVTPPWWKSRTLWASVVSAVTGLPALLDALRAIPGLNLPDGVATTLAVISAVSLWIAPYLARAGGVEAAAQVLRKTRNESRRHLQ